MGKYIKKSKTVGEVAVMDVSPSPLGVRTRAKTLALQRTSSSSPSTSACYLQLRSRRLLKPSIFTPTSDPRRPKHPPNPNPNPNPNPSSLSSSPPPQTRHSSRIRVRPLDSGSASVHEFNNHSVQLSQRLSTNVVEPHGDHQYTDKEDSRIGDGNDEVAEDACCGENVLDSEARDSTRESTPCSMIPDPDVMHTPGSSTRPTSMGETASRFRTPMQRHIPTTHEMEELFTGAEEQQQRQFIEKYNFDPVNDKPLPGRYKWERLKP